MCGDSELLNLDEKKNLFSQKNWEKLFWGERFFCLKFNNAKMLEEAGVAVVVP